MCDLKKNSTLETVKVYKVCYKHKDKYYAYFSGMRIKVGKVAGLPFKRNINGRFFREYADDKRHYGYKLYNELAVGRTTGFKSKRIATNLQFGDGGPSCNAVLLEMVITGDIVRGTGGHIIGYWEDLNKAIVYAGREIVSFKEVCFEPDMSVVKMLFKERERRRLERHEAAVKRRAEWNRRREERDKRYFEERRKRHVEIISV